MTPSNFTNYPWGSALTNSECETIAVNIMVILSRTGNVFRELTWEEYESERMKDKNFSAGEKPYFEKVLPYCKNADTAKLFSKSWN